MTYRIYPIYLGYNDVDANNAYWRDKSGANFKLTCGAFVLQSEDGEFIPVDSGIPSAAEIRAKGLPHRQMKDEHLYEEEIRKIGVKPEEVKRVILTHLHWDHSWNLGLFPNAKIYVQRREMQHAVAPMKHELKSYSLVPGNGGVADWMKYILQFEPLDGDTDFAPGIRILATPGHTPGSLSVMVDTKDGLYGLVSDFAMTPRNLEECIPVGSMYSMPEWYDSWRKLKAYGSFVPLSPHDAAVYGRVYG